MTQFYRGLGLFLSLFFISNSLIAQFNAPQSRVWALGNKKGLDFSTTPPTIINTGLMNANEGSATVSNHLGELQFCTNGTHIWNADGVTMPNGTNINGSGLNTVSTTQAAVIVPIPNSDTRYFVFSMTPVSNCRLYSNVVDMSLADGLGDVDTTYHLRKVMLRNGLTEKMTVAAGCNNDVWLLVHSNASATFYAYHITENGLDTNAVISHSGTLSGAVYNQGVMKVSNDGRKIMTNTFSAQGQELGTELYDFDPSTGMVSNARMIDVINAYGGTFSPKGTKLYVQEITNPGSVYQYDLTATNVTASKTLVGRSGQYCDMKIGPDEKIYVASNINSMGFNSYRYFARINAPDEIGVACNFQDTVSTLAFPAATGNNGVLTQGLPNDIIIARPGFVNSTLKMDSLLCNVETISVEVNLPSSAQSIVWNNDFEGSAVEITEAGIYIAKYNHSCVNYIDTFKVEVSQITAPIISRDGDNLLLTTEAASVQWYLDNELIGSTSNQIQIERSGLYRAEVQNEEGCTAEVEFLVESELNSEYLEVGRLNVYPNPAVGGELTVNSNLKGVIRIVDLNGKILFTKAVNSGETKVDLQNLKAGMYILELISEETAFIYQTKVIR